MHCQFFVCVSVWSCDWELVLVGNIQFGISFVLWAKIQNCLKKLENIFFPKKNIFFCFSEKWTLENNVFFFLIFVYRIDPFMVARENKSKWVFVVYDTNLSSQIPFWQIFCYIKIVKFLLSFTLHRNAEKESKGHVRHLISLSRQCILQINK